MGEDLLKAMLKLACWIFLGLAALMLIFAGLMIFTPKIFLKIIWHTAAVLGLAAAIFMIASFIRSLISARKQHQTEGMDNTDETF